MTLISNNKTRVVLPGWIFARAGDDKQELKRLIVDYMKRYPGYKILKVKDGFAICEIDR